MRSTKIPSRDRCNMDSLNATDDTVYRRRPNNIDKRIPEPDESIVLGKDTPAPS